MSNTIDLQDSSVAGHWDQVEQRITHILDTMQRHEDWPLDDQNELKNAIIAWASTLDNTKFENILDEKANELLRVFAFTKCKRSMYLLQKLEELSPGATVRLLRQSLGDVDMAIDDNRARQVFRDRLVALFRVDLIDRIFSEERSKNIKTAIQTTTEKYGGIYGS